jgi:hypothetical protein
VGSVALSDVLARSLARLLKYTLFVCRRYMYILQGGRSVCIITLPVRYTLRYTLRAYGVSYRGRALGVCVDCGVAGGDG